MRSCFSVLLAASIAALVLLPQPAAAAPSDSTDFGDAPEGVEAYHGFIPAMAHFPSCLASTPPGTRQLSLCPPISTEPGNTGFIKHVPSRLGRRYWLGCNDVSIDYEGDAKNSPADPPGIPCSPVPGDCVESVPAWLGGVLSRFDQDECDGDGVDAGVGINTFGGGFPSCWMHYLQLSIYNDLEACAVYLNVLVDQNWDGDWNDQTDCNDGQNCGYEWGVKNAVIQLEPGCNSIATPLFRVGAGFGPPAASWTRITLTDDPVDDDFPWKGSAGLPDDAYSGGETEDSPVGRTAPDPALPTSWGRLKQLYR
jgi:hypothetical protein